MRLGETPTYARTNGATSRIGSMLDHRYFQLRLWHFFAASAVVGAGCWFYTVFILPAVTTGSQRDLPIAERALLASLQSDGLRVVDAFT